ncbi:MAG: D-glycero-beta-D-manno-heptose 1-phosphate adenylyltransferase [Candidatus Electrothrix sp. AR3]|nr:D-glycero-beta-D-manno-heptose 1-phosphate adenylyltransferase [Candidatus Electrothrix sp. AR3]
MLGEETLAGHSMIVDPAGKVLAEAGGQVESIYADLEEDRLDKNRSRFCTGGERPWADRDKKKIFTLDHLVQQLTWIRQQKSKIIFTNGCFDLLHPGHVSYLEEARASGDCLVVGLNSDRSVQALKGMSRPVNSEQDRARVLASLGCVDFITIFDEDTPYRLIMTLQPDILVKGADWPEDQIIGASEVKAKGGVVKRIPFDHQKSTTAIIEKILSTA